MFAVHTKTATRSDDENIYALGPGKELQVTTDKPVYQVGEPVRISIANTGSETVELSGSPPFDIYNETGDPVCCVHLWVILDINPGEVLHYVWDQTTVWTGDQVPPGTYTVEVISGLPVEPSTTFVIEVMPAGLQVLQVGLCLDGSGSINDTEWDIIIKGVATAIQNNVPHDATVELTVVQFGYTSTATPPFAKVEIPPTVVTAANYQNIANTIGAMKQGTGLTPMADGLFLCWDQMKKSSNFPNATRQVINVATDGVPTEGLHLPTPPEWGSPPGTSGGDATWVRDQAAKEGLEELDAEAIGEGPDLDWMRDSLVYPQPGYIAPPWPIPYKPGWVEHVKDALAFADAAGKKLQRIIEPLACGRAVNVVFEEANLPLYTISSNPAADAVGGYAEFANNLIREGYKISTIDPGTTIDAYVLEPVDVLVIVCPQGAYSTSEIDAIENWVKADGGRLLLIGDWNGSGLQSNRIAARFDFFLGGDMIRDHDEYVGLDTGRPYYDGANLHVHPITAGVSRVEVYKGDGIYRSPIDEFALIVTDLDGTATWYYGEPALGVSVMSTLDGDTAGSGKLVLMTDSNVWDSEHDTDNDGSLNLDDSDNAVLALNSIDWLAEGVALGELTAEWNYTLGAIDYFQTFCPSAAVADLGVNNNNGEPDLDLEIVTGTDEYYVGQMWHCLDTTGQREWALPTGCDESRSSVAVADIDGDEDLEIAGGTTSGWLLQVFDHKGSFLWTYYPGYYAFWKSSPAICELNPDIAGLEVVAATYQDGTVWCFDGITGTVLWNYTIGAIVESSPACGDVDNDGDPEVIIGAYDSFLYCFDALTGGLERTYRTGGAVLSSPALANVDRDLNLEVFVGSNDGKVYCFDGKGTVQWTYQTAGAVLSSPSVADVNADGRYEVVVGSNDDNIYCLDAGTGTLVWSYKTDGSVISSAALADRGGTGLGIYIASMDGHLHVLDGKGRLFDKFNTQATNGITSSPVVADIDGDRKLEVIFTDWNAVPDDFVKTNKIWCLEDCGSNVTEYAVEWQMFRHDACRTGLYPEVVRPPALHDVAIAGVTTTKNNPVTGETITINVFVQNQGTTTETFTVSVDYDGVSIGNTSVTLTSGATTTETFIWDTTGVSAGLYTMKADASVVPGETDIADNTFLVPIQILPALFHDIAVNSVTPSKIFVVAGETISVDVEVENQGDYTETFTVDVYYDGNSIDSLTATLTAGTSQTLTFSWDTTNVPKGVYTLKAAAAVVPNEIETFDNTFTSIVQVTVAVHDTAIAFVIPVQTVVGQGLDVTIAVEVINQGDFTETFDLTVYANATLIQTKTINLESKYNMLVTFTWNTQAAAIGNYTIGAHATPVPGETDTADNTLIDGWVLIHTLLGDLNGDCVVNIMDIAIVAQAFGSNPGHPRWNPIADLDGNNNVNIIDISIVAKEYGKTC